MTISCRLASHRDRLSLRLTKRLQIIVHPFALWYGAHALMFSELSRSELGLELQRSRVIVNNAYAGTL